MEASDRAETTAGLKLCRRRNRGRRLIRQSASEAGIDGVDAPRKGACVETVARTSDRFSFSIFRRRLVREELNGCLRFCSALDVIRSRPAPRLAMAPRSLVRADAERRKVPDSNRGHSEEVLVKEKGGRAFGL